MKKILYILIIASVSSVMFYGCGGGSGTGATAGGGIGGSGAIASGQITAKGSITVNEVKYETDRVRVLFDGIEFSDDSRLKVGMIVQVEGTRNLDGISGDAAVVRFDDSVEGPITLIDIAGREIEVLGQPVLVDDLTIYENVAGLGSLIIGDFVEVSGQLDELGNTRATFIERKAVPGAEVEVTGFVDGLSGNTFMINSLTVDFSVAILENFGGGRPADGDFVEVKGLAINFNPGSNSLTASSVENKARNFDEGLEAEVEGFIESLTAAGFTIVATSGRIQVQVDGATVFSGGAAGDLKVGMKVEAEGQILGGVLLADKISFEDNVRIEVAAGTQTDVDPLTVELRLLPGIIVRVDDRTELEDNRSGAPPPTDAATLLNSIAEDDALKVRGRPVGGEVLATELEVDDPSGNLDRIDLRGPVDADPTDTRFLEILGILIDTDIFPGTTFADINDNPISRTVFFGSGRAGTQVDVSGDLNAIGDRIDASELDLED
jgi:hypothetical protein